MADMDFFDRGILAVLKEEKPRHFQQILSEVGFSHNTLKPPPDPAGRTGPRGEA